MSINTSTNVTGVNPRQEGPQSPGEYLEKSILSQMSQSALARELGVSRAAISYVVNGKRSLSPGMAHRLSDFTGLPMSFWMELQQNWEVWQDSPQGQEELRAIETEKTVMEWVRIGPRILSDVEIVQAIDCGLLQIEPYSETHLKRASYDFRIGHVACTVGKKHSQVLPRDNHYHLEPGRIYTVSTKEVLVVGNRVVGRLGPPTTLTEQFLFFSIGLQIDPGFGSKTNSSGARGKRIVCVIENRGSEKVSVGVEEAFLSSEFSFLGRAVSDSDVELRPGSKDGAFSKIDQ